MMEWEEEREGNGKGGWEWRIKGIDRGIKDDREEEEEWWE